MLPNAAQTFLHRIGKLLHLREQRVKALGSHPDPSTLGYESTLGLLERLQLVGILEYQAHLISFHGRQIANGEGLEFNFLILIQALRILAERPPRLLELRAGLLFSPPDPFGCPDAFGYHIGLVVDHIGIEAVVMDPFEVGRAHALADLLQGVPMAVVSFQILEEFGPNTRIFARCRKQGPSLHQIGKDADAPVAFPYGHIGDTNTVDIGEVDLLARASMWH